MDLTLLKDDTHSKGGHSMNIKDLTKMVEETVGSKVTWELGKKYIALDTTTGKVVAEYTPKTGRLYYR
jgi:hypothetical protein